MPTTSASSLSQEAPQRRASTGARSAAAASLGAPTATRRDMSPSLDGGASTADIQDNTSAAGISSVTCRGAEICAGSRACRSAPTARSRPNRAAQSARRSRLRKRSANSAMRAVRQCNPLRIPRNSRPITISGRIAHDRPLRRRPNVDRADASQALPCERRNFHPDSTPTSGPIHASYPHAPHRRRAARRRRAGRLLPRRASRRTDIIDVKPGGNFKPINVAITPFAGDAAARTITSVITNNFKRSVFLQPVDRPVSRSRSAIPISAAASTPGRRSTRNSS